MTLTPLPASPPSPAGGPAPSPSGGSPDPEFEALVASHRERADAHSDRTPAGVTSGSPDHGGPAGPQATRHNGADAPNREKDDRDEPASAGSAAQQPPAGSQGATPGQGVPTAAAPTQPSGPGGSPAGASTGGPAVTAPAAGAAAVAGPARSSARSTASGKQPGTISAGPGQRSGATVGGAAQPAARGSGAPGHAAPAPGTGAGSTGTAAPVSRNPALSGAAGRVAGQAAGTSAGQAAGTSAGQARHAVTDSDGDLHAGTTTPASGAGASGVPVPTAPNAPVSAAAPSAGGPAGGTSTAVPVPAQLQPSLVRLVSRGDGTHRMSLRLHPAELGEVRLTVTVKDGAVDVAMAAGPEAQDTLREGSAQLRAMLSGSGHTLGQL
ncbi:MAG TPA: flagellar hook-length control protein FliK, partial [Nocardioidaceae bacterium]|nr:flagellar hook-length control protein FliK [Nocardioidaceae bacterium]